MVIDKNKYIAEAKYLLSDTSFYKKKLSLDPTKHYMSELHSLISHLHHSIEATVKAFVPENPKPDTFYTIPKLHKHSKIIMATTTNLSIEDMNSNPHL